MQYFRSSFSFWCVFDLSLTAHLRVDFQLPRNFYVRTWVKFTFTNKIEAMHGRLLVSVKVEPSSTSRLISTLHILPLFYFRDWNLRALTSVAKNASVEISLHTMSMRLRFDHPSRVFSNQWKRSVYKCGQKKNTAQWMSFWRKMY